MPTFHTGSLKGKFSLRGFITDEEKELDHKDSQPANVSLADVSPPEKDNLSDVHRGLHEPALGGVTGVDDGKDSQPADVTVETPPIQSQLQDSLCSDHTPEGSMDTTSKSQGKGYCYAIICPTLYVLLTKHTANGLSCATHVYKNIPDV